MAKTRSKMPLSQRAKQFMPFAALKGLDEAFEAKELEVEMIERRQLSSSQKEEINSVLISLAKGDQVIAEYFDNGRVLIIKGNLKSIDEMRSIIQIDDRKIMFKDLYSISRI